MWVWRALRCRACSPAAQAPLVLGAAGCVILRHRPSCASCLVFSSRRACVSAAEVHLGWSGVVGQRGSEEHFRPLNPARVSVPPVFLPEVWVASLPGLRCSEQAGVRLFAVGSSPGGRGPENNEMNQTNRGVTGSRSGGPLESPGKLRWGRRFILSLDLAGYFSVRRTLEGAVDRRDHSRRG